MKTPSLICTLCVGVIGFLVISPSAFAVTADNVKCDKCVGVGDIAKKAVTSSRIKPGAVTGSKIKDGAVTESKLSGGVLDLMQSSSSAKRYVIVDINDQVVGGAIGDGEGGADPLIMSPQGYIATTSIYEGVVIGGSSVFFAGADCTGTAYVSVSTSGQVDIGGEQTAYFYRQMIGEVANLWGYDSTVSQIDYWYIPKTPTLVDNMPVQSLKVRVSEWLETAPEVWEETESVECYTVSYMLTKGAEAFPNDPAITGFPNDAFSAPLRYDYR